MSIPSAGLTDSIYLLNVSGVWLISPFLTAPHSGPDPVLSPIDYPSSLRPYVSTLTLPSSPPSCLFSAKHRSDSLKTSNDVKPSPLYWEWHQGFSRSVSALTSLIPIWLLLSLASLSWTPWASPLWPHGSFFSVEQPFQVCVSHSSSPRYAHTPLSRALWTPVWIHFLCLPLDLASFSSGPQCLHSG